MVQNWAHGVHNWVKLGIAQCQIRGFFFFLQFFLVLLLCFWVGPVRSKIGSNQLVRSVGPIGSGIRTHRVQDWVMWGRHSGSLIRVNLGQVGRVYLGGIKKSIRQLGSNGHREIWPFQIREFFQFQKPLPFSCRGWNIVCFQDLANCAFWGKPKVVWCIQHDWPKK